MATVFAVVERMASVVPTVVLRATLVAVTVGSVVFSLDSLVFTADVTIPPIRSAGPLVPLDRSAITDPEIVDQTVMVLDVVEPLIGTAYTFWNVTLPVYTAFDA